MTRIGLLSDTHAYWDEKYLEYFEPCDEIWHAGDIGSLEVAEKLAAFRPLRAVYGNIDGQEIRKLFPQVNRFTVDGAEVLIKHIGGYPGKYDPSIVGSLMTRPTKERSRIWKLSSWRINNFALFLSFRISFRPLQPVNE